MSMANNFSDIGRLFQNMERMLSDSVSKEQYLQATDFIADFEAVIGLLMLNQYVLNKLAVEYADQEKQPYIAEMNLMFSELGRTLAEIQVKRDQLLRQG